MKEHFIEEFLQMTNKHMQRCSISLTIRELEIKTTRYHYTPIGMAEIKNKNKNKKQQQ